MCVDVGGHEMLLDAGDSLGLKDGGLYEPLLTEFFQRFIQQGNTVLDLGANIGYHTLKFARLVDTDGRVFAFEPEPGCFSILKGNVERNGYRNIVLEQQAVSDTTGVECLYLDNTGNNGAHSLLAIPGASSVIVDTVRLDDYFAGYDGVIDFIKMDIEGTEPRALAGMSNIINGNPNLKLVVEVNLRDLDFCNMSLAAYVELFSDNGFALHYINDREGIIEPLDMNKLVSYFNTGGCVTNLLCVKGSEFQWV